MYFLYLLFFLVIIKFNSMKIFICSVLCYYPQHLEQCLALKAFIEGINNFYTYFQMSFYVCLYIQPHIDIEIKFYKNGIIFCTYSCVTFFVFFIYLSHRSISVTITMVHYHILKLLQRIPSCLSQQHNNNGIPIKSDNSDEVDILLRR